MTAILPAPETDNGVRPPRTATQPVPLFRIGEQLRPIPTDTAVLGSSATPRASTRTTSTSTSQAVLRVPLYLKCEGFNFAGSIKLKAATAMVEAAERDGMLTPGSDARRVLVRQPRRGAEHDRRQQGLPVHLRHRLPLQPATRRLMEALGSQVHVITEPDEVGGLLGARIDYVRAAVRRRRPVRLAEPVHEPEQLAGALPAPPRPRSPAQFPDLDVLFVGAGTTGTLMGCARFFREWHRQVRVVAVDTVGSVTFGGPPGRRMIPGLGTSVRPPLLDESFVDDVVLVEEADTVRACHRLARRGFLFGGSTGTVVSGAMSWLDQHDGRELTAVAIAPDLGERYLDTIYQHGLARGDVRQDVLDDPTGTRAGPAGATVACRARRCSVAAGNGAALAR